MNDVFVARWVLCSERMPDEETNYLICTERGRIGIDLYSYTLGWLTYDVIAWMPLPEPPEVET